MICFCNVIQLHISYVRNYSSMALSLIFSHSLLYYITTYIYSFILFTFWHLSNLFVDYFSFKCGLTTRCECFFIILIYIHLFNITNIEWKKYNKNRLSINLIFIIKLLNLINQVCKIYMMCSIYCINWYNNDLNDLIIVILVKIVLRIRIL